MLKKSVTYEDLDGNSVTEDFYFHLTKAELIEMEVNEEGGLSNKIQEITGGGMDSEKGKQVLALTKMLLLNAIGEREGARFVKNQSHRDNFVQTEAYSELLMELATDADKLADFIKGLVPRNLEKILEEMQERADKRVETVELPAEKEDTRPAWIKEDREPTDRELTEMPRAELVEAMRRKNAAKK